MEVLHTELWVPWKVRTVGFSLPWWLAIAPTLVESLWHRAGGTVKPALLDVVMEIASWLSYLAIPVGVLTAIMVLLESSECDYRRAARWFLFGALAMPFLVTLSLAVWSTL
jgi:hypothetical protein